MSRDFLKGFKGGTKKFGENISIIINSFLLSLVYFFGVGITSIIAKIFKKNFLDLKINSKLKTYWSELKLTKKSLREYYRQF